MVLLFFLCDFPRGPGKTGDRGEQKGETTASRCLERDVSLSLRLFFSFFIFFNLLAVLRDMWDLSFPTRDQSRGPCIESMES